MVKYIGIFLCFSFLFAYAEPKAENWHVKHQFSKTSDCVNCDEFNTIIVTLENSEKNVNFQFSIDGESFSNKQVELKEYSIGYRFYKDRMIVLLRYASRDRVVIIDLASKKPIIDYLCSGFIISDDGKYLTYLNYRPRRAAYDIVDSVYVYDLDKNLSDNLDIELRGKINDPGFSQNIGRNFNIGRIICPKEFTYKEHAGYIFDKVNNVSNLCFVAQNIIGFTCSNETNQNICIFEIKDNEQDSAVFVHNLVKGDKYSKVDSAEFEQPASAIVDKIELLDMKNIRVYFIVDGKDKDKQNSVTNIEYKNKSSDVYYPFDPDKNMKKAVFKKEEMQPKNQSLMTESLSVNYGVVSSDSKITKTYWIKNMGEKTLEIDRIESSSANITSALDKSRLESYFSSGEANSKAIITISLDPKGLYGQIAEKITIYSKATVLATVPIKANITGK